MIVENDCLILQNLADGRWRNQRRGYYEWNDPPAEGGPYLSLRLDLAPALVSSVMVESGHVSASDPAEMRAIVVSPLDGNQLDAFVRLTRLLDSPAEAQVLLPLFTREIIYRL